MVKVGGDGLRVAAEEKAKADEPEEGGDFREEISEVTSAGWTGLEPAASGVTGTRRGLLTIRAQTKCRDYNYL